MGPDLDLNKDDSRDGGPKTTLALSRRDRPGRWRLFGNRAFLYTNVYRKIWYNKQYE